MKGGVETEGRRFAEGEMMLEGGRLVIEGGARRTGGVGGGGGNGCSDMTDVGKLCLLAPGAVLSDMDGNVAGLPFPEES